jgi:hypothetical protein
MVPIVGGSLFLVHGAGMLWMLAISGVKRFVSRAGPYSPSSCPTSSPYVKRPRSPGVSTLDVAWPQTAVCVHETSNDSHSARDRYASSSRHAVVSLVSRMRRSAKRSLPYTSERTDRLCQPKQCSGGGPAFAKPICSAWCWCTRTTFSGLQMVSSSACRSAQIESRQAERHGECEKTRQA